MSFRSIGGPDDAAETFFSGRLFFAFFGGGVSSRLSGVEVPSSISDAIRFLCATLLTIARGLMLQGNPTALRAFTHETGVLGYITHLMRSPSLTTSIGLESSSSNPSSTK